MADDMEKEFRETMQETILEIKLKTEKLLKRLREESKKKQVKM
jgi:hypothetical protein